jgi:predicted dienelactone hydrolase
VSKTKRKTIVLAVKKLFSASSWQKQRKLCQASLLALLSCSFLADVSILPAVSADRIAFNYGVLGEFYISLADLETFAKEGKITPSLAYYADRFSQEDLAELRDLLNRHFDLNVVTASIFLNSPIGKQLIREISSIVDSPAKITQPALRGSVILAAAQPQGLTILDVLRLYSTDTIKLNTDKIVEAVDEATKILADTERVFTALEREAAKNAETASSINFDTLANLGKSGAKKWHKESLIIKPQGGRTIQGVVYLPVANDRPAPVVVIAPGLNTDWQNFTYIAEHLASYGFGVAAVNFPGTNASRVNAVLNGLDTSPPNNQWLEQPKVITRLLDEIERKSQSDPTWQGKLDLQRVGVIGQSLGGYTAMAIAGAQVNWQHLQRECQQFQSPERINFNPSLYWQCQGTGTASSPPDTDLQDKRIVAAIAVNPVTNPVFSQSALSQMRLPLMIITGDKDVFTPALEEQIEPFTWLPQNDKYLVLVENSTHFSFIEERDSRESELPPQIIGTNPKIARSYLKVLSVAFFKTYLAQQKQFTPYLTESYLRIISKQPLPLNLIRSLNASQLRQLVENRE